MVKWLVTTPCLTMYFNYKLIGTGYKWRRFGHQLTRLLVAFKFGQSFLCTLPVLQYLDSLCFGIVPRQVSTQHLLKFCWNNAPLQSIFAAICFSNKILYNIYCTNLYSPCKNIGTISSHKSHVWKHLKYMKNT